MKYTILALLGMTQAKLGKTHFCYDKTKKFENMEICKKYFEDLKKAKKEELAELAGTRWNWRAVGPMMGQEFRIMHTLEEIAEEYGDEMEKGWNEMMEDAEEDAKRYAPLFEAWEKTKTMQAKKAHDKKMWMESEMGKNFWESLHNVGVDAMNTHWAKGINQDGYAEWIKNEDAAALFESMYGVKEAFKALAESKMMAENNKLGMATLAEPAAKKIEAQFFEDMGVKSWKGVHMKLRKMFKQAVAQMGECPLMRKLAKQIGRLVDLAERTQEHFDLPSKEEFAAWWGEHDFQPWI